LFFPILGPTIAKKITATPNPREKQPQQSTFTKKQETTHIKTNKQKTQAFVWAGGNKVFCNFFFCTCSSLC